MQERGDIRAISPQIVSASLDPENFRTYQDTEMTISELTKIQGIGQWTAEFTVLRGLHRPDAFPADDISVLRSIARFSMNDTNISAAQARSSPERWGPWKGGAAYYLEIADLLGISLSCYETGIYGLHSSILNTHHTGLWIAFETCILLR